MQNLTEIELRILRLLQDDSNLSRQELADRAGMSVSTLWRKVHDLDEAGVVRKSVALLDPGAVGLPVCVFVFVDLGDYQKENQIAFETFVERSPEIMECFAVTGSHDYILIIRTAGVAEFESFLMEKILPHPAVASATSQIALRQHKYTTALPI